ncbi:YadA-like family protein [Paraburkholderia phymatum]|nr:YadA-like family protein [Paraburkholderia phymatum]
MSVGSAGAERRVTNVAAGLNGTDAVNVSQLMAEDARVNVLSNTVNNIGNNGNGGTIKYFHANSTAADSAASGQNSIAVGPQALASNSYGIAMGPLATASGVSGVAIGAASLSTAQQSDAFGDYATASGLYSVALGNQSTASAQSALAVGDTAIASGVNSSAIGRQATASTSNSVALGANSIASSTTLGSAGFNPGGASINASTAVGEVSIGSANAERRLTNVAAGYSATDAVNVSQLMSEDAKVNAEGAATAAALGGGSSYNSTTGAITNPTYNISGGTYNNVAGALTSIDARINNIGNGSSGGNLKYFHANSSLADSTATGVDSVVAGPAATASANSAVALGADSVADRDNTVSVGSSTAQRQITNMAAGTAATDAVNVSQLTGVTTAIGGGASVKADGTIAQPTFNVYGQTYSNVGDALASINNNTGNIVQNLKYIKFGASTAAAAQAGGTDSIAIGGNAVATANGAIAIGRGANATASNSVALGVNSVANTANTFAVGSAVLTRRIVNVADGTATTDAATVGQVNADIQAAIASLQTPLTSKPALLGSTPTLRSTQLLGATSSLTPDQLIFSGPTDKAGMTYAQGQDSIAIGLNSQATADYAVAIGDNAQSLDNSTVAIGQTAITDGQSAVAIGSQVSANGSYAIAIGNNGTLAQADNAIAIGNNVQVGGVNTMAVGENIVSTGTNSIVLGYASADGGRANVLSVGSSTQQRQIVNVAAGTQNTDAVNVSQLKGAVSALGGGATVNPTTGVVTAPAYNVAGGTYVNVGAALSALDAGEKAISNNVMNVTNVVNNITNGGGIKYFHTNSTLADSLANGANSVAIGGNAVATTSNSVALGSNSVASAATLSSAGFAPGGFSISATTATGEVSVGAQGAERRVTNIAAGYAATDAVNVSQLMAEDQRVNVVSNNLSNLSNVVNNLGGSINLKYFHSNSTLTDSTASGTDAVAVGPQATAAGTSAIAIGNSASATAANSVALGSNATTTANLSAAAYNPGSATLSGTTASGEVSVGNASFNRRITNVAAGSAATDAVNVSQLMSEDAKVNAEGAGTAAALGGGSSYNASTGAITNPTYNVSGGTYNNIAGALTGIDARVTNMGNNITYLNNVINNTIINGGGIKYFHANSTLADSTASGTDSVAIGGAASASASNSVALGSNATTTANLSAAAYNPGSTTLSGTTAAGEVSVGNAGLNRRITNLAAGSAATDAVNVSQLMSEDAKVNAEGAATAAALGGGSSYNPSTGAITNPTYNVAGATTNNVGGALTSIDARINNIQVGGGIKYFHANSTLADSTASGMNSVAIGGAAMASASNSVALGANSLANSSTLASTGFAPGGLTISAGTAAGEVSVGTSGAERRITNVAAGYSATDAVNLSQLMAEDAKVNNVSNNLTNLSNIVNNISGGSNLKYFQVNSSLANASATGTDSVAAGPNAVATASNAVALGANSVADRANTVSVGSSGSQRQIVNLAAGTNPTDAVNVSQLAGVTAALGGGATVNPTTGAIVAPAYNVLGNTYSNVGSALSAFLDASSNLQTSLKYINFGPSTAAKSQASGTDAIAIGGNAVATANGAVAIGRGANATASNSVALGVNSVANTANTFAVGSAVSTRRIVNVADGTAATDAATVGQVNADIQTAITNLQTSLASKPALLGSAPAVRSTQLVGAVGGAFPSPSSLTPDQLIFSGPTDKVGMTYAEGQDSMAIGLNSQATADYAVAIGDNAQSLDNSAVAIGQTAITDGQSAVAIGSQVSANGDYAIAIGNNGTLVQGANDMAIGNNVQVGGVNTMAIGENIVTTGTNDVVLGYASTDGGRANIVSVGSNTQQRQIINVAAGTQKTDAVNVSQLSGVTTALGGGASVNPTTGAVVAPAYSLAGSTYSNVGAALSSLDTRIASSGDPLAVDYDAAAKNQITLKGASGTKISGLMAGALNATSSEAVNGSQLYAQGVSTAQALGGGASVNTTTGAITAPQYTFGGATYTNVGDALTALNNAAGSGNALGVVYNAQDKSEITLAGANGTKIDKLAAGDVNASSSDAVNGAQLYNVAASAANAIGGGSTVNNDGTISNPTYVVGGSTVTTIGGAITNLDARVYANSTDITNLQTQINEGGIGLVTQDATSKNILVASATGGSLVDFTGTAGARRLTGVAAGNVSASSLEAVNGTQLYNVAASAANAIGGGSTVNNDGTISNPTYVVGGSTVTTIGGAITNLDARVYANSTDITNLQTQINEGGIGMVTQDQPGSNILVASKTDGSVVDFTGTAGARILSGVAAGVAATDAVNVGQLQAAGIIDPNGKTKAAVTYDTNANGSTDYSSITLGDGTANAAPVTIHNVAAGTQSNDAVNYSQYAALQAQVNNITNAGTGVDTLFVGDGDRNTEAAQAGGTHATAMGALSVANGTQSVAAGYASNASGQNAVAMGANASASGNNAVALGAGSVADQDNTVSVGSATQQRRVTNVAAGTASTDAVNVGQLNEAIAQANASVDDKVSQGVQSANAYTNQQINNLDKKMNSLGAAAMAATSLIPNARAEGNFQMSAAAGTYGGAAAIALGANYWVNDRLLVNAHVTRSTGYGASTGASVGATFGF